MKKQGKVNQDRKALAGLCQMLFNNEISPGQKTSYRDLAEKLGLSTTPVIHALKWLEFMDIVQHEPNRGYFVKGISVEEVEEIYDTRLLLEVALLPLAVKNVDQAGLQRIAQAVEDHGRASANGDHYRRLLTDMKFHLSLASLSKRKIQTKLLKDLFDRLLLKYNKDLVSHSMFETSSNEHQNIARQLAKRDLEGLTAALTGHLTKIKMSIVAGLRVTTALAPEELTYPILSFDDALLLS